MFLKKRGIHFSLYGPTNPHLGQVYSFPNSRAFLDLPISDSPQFGHLNTTCAESFTNLSPY